MSYNFGELKTAIQSYTDNSETTFVANISNFIKSAEQRIFYNVDLENFRKNATGVMSTGNQFLRTPTDFLAPFSLFITTSGSEGFLLEKDVNFMREAYNSAFGAFSLNHVYSVSANVVRLAGL